MDRCGRSAAGDSQVRLSLLGTQPKFRQSQRGRLFNVEVQVQRFPRWSVRSAFYLSRLLASQIDAGQAYLELKPVVGVHLLDFELFDDHPSALWHLEMRDRHDPSARLGDELPLHVVELRKADRAWRVRRDDGNTDVEGAVSASTGGAGSIAGPIMASASAEDTTRGALQAWIAFLKRWKEAKEVSDLAYPPVQQALKKLQDPSRNEEDRYRAIARERALYNELTLSRDAREEGRQEGLTLAKTATLTRQLTRRFGGLPEWASKRVREASVQMQKISQEIAVYETARKAYLAALKAELATSLPSDG